MKAADQIATTIAQGINEHLDTNNDVNVFSMPARMPIVNNFVLLFYNSFLQSIDDYNLSINDVRVMLKIVDLMKFGNLLKLSWSSVGRSLGIAPKNMVRHVSKLKDARLLINDADGNTYLNPQICSKGKFLQKLGKNGNELIKVLELGADALQGTNIEPSIVTPSMRQASLFDKD